MAMVLNQQTEAKVDLADLRRYVRQVKRLLERGRGDFNVCLVDDQEIRRLNQLYRGKDAATDVLSFPWHQAEEPDPEHPGTSEFEGFWGDIVISVKTARQNARAEHHSTQEEIRLLILHGALHLLGYDHEIDQGEMAALELSLRERLAAVSARCRTSPDVPSRHTG